MPSPQMPASWTVIIAAGLLVGFGTRLGGGCTSGHGICGIARALRPFRNGYRHFHIHGDCSRRTHSSRARRLSHAGHHSLDLRVDIWLGLADFGQKKESAAVRKIASILAGIPLMTPSLREIVAIF